MKLKLLVIATILIMMGNGFIASANLEDEEEDNALIPCVSKVDLGAPTVKINIDPYTIIYEGDIIDCNITGNPTVKYWSINSQSLHTTFYDDNPVIFDPEPTPLEDTYVDLTVYVENEAGNSSDTVPVMIKRIYFGDIHFHTTLSDGQKSPDVMYENAFNDNYLDFAGSTDHGCNIPFFKKYLLIRMIFNKIKWGGPWSRTKSLNNNLYQPGRFTTLLGFEWGKSHTVLGDRKYNSKGDDESHINFYYRENYNDAAKYSRYQKRNYDDILETMNKEYNNGYKNIGFLHHPLAKLPIIFFGEKALMTHYNNISWDYFVNKIKNTEERDRIIRGVEVYSVWGTAIGKFSNIPIHWPYLENPSIENWCVSVDSNESWVENGLWEWSEKLKNRNFVMMASSDSHNATRPGSAELDKMKPSGLIAAYSVHNQRDEIWDAINSCNVYGTQLLKIRANVKFDDQMALGRWINCTSPLKINISAMSTFSGLDNSGKNMCPYDYSSDEIDYPISDIWLVKKDRDSGQPWCKVIGHSTPNTDLAFVEFQDSDVQPNDFYYVVIRQKGEELTPGQEEYTAFLGPVFIDNVEIFEGSR